MHKLYCFGFNAFGQTGNETKEVLSEACLCENIKAVLYANWEVTIGTTYSDDSLYVWGFQSILTKKLVEQCKAKLPTCIFGDPNTTMGFIDNHETLYLISRSFECSFKAVRHAVYSQQCVFMLDYQGEVKRLDCQDLACAVPEALQLPLVNTMYASSQHVLFLTNSVDTPVFGLGSNKLCQLGILEDQEIRQPIAIDYFCGLMTKVEQASCGLFHSAVILNGDVYTFGWSKDGRLGSGTYDKEDVITLAQCVDDQDQPVEIQAVQVSCGSTHTLILDDQGQVWSCGSSRYTTM
ncbi:regulator of chromosome condensation 1/beta-lactamase-inhibitor protein II [Choanephora cucurbitarum]|nr:regulator of chromosome condensation 1/beta-lactamase-inhibitor protein II [Choanephora cucurbitarum]